MEFSTYNKLLFLSGYLSDVVFVGCNNTSSFFFKHYSENRYDLLEKGGFILAVSLTALKFTNAICED